MAGNRGYVKFDWITIIVYFALVGIGWINIYSASVTDTAAGFFDFSQIYAKQFIWIVLSLIIIVFLLALDTKFYERFSSIIYIVSLASLLGLFLLGKNINGATSWYAIGNLSIQPSEFAKAATALALGKYVSDIQTNMKEFKDQLRAFLIIALPALFIIPQPDPGSALIYAAFIFPLYREGLHFIYLLLGFFLAALFVATLAFGVVWVSIGCVLIIALIYMRQRRKRKAKLLNFASIAVACVAFAFSVNYIFK